MFKYVKYMLMVMILGISFVTFQQIAQADDEVVNATQVASFQKISPEYAKQLMDTEKNYIIIDVRTTEEYNEGHVKNAISLPNEEIVVDSEKVATILQNKDQMLLVYCRSGKRAAEASTKLVNMGYTNVYSFGGIIDWPYEIVK